MGDSASAGGPGAVRPDPQRPCVLYIEDDAPNVRLVEYILSEIHNLKFVAAATGEHGLRLAHELHPNLILLDLQLPDMDGEEVLRRLRVYPPTRDVPVVIMSGDLGERQRARLSECGIVSFLDKPYGVGDLVAIVKRLIAPAS